MSDQEFLRKLLQDAKQLVRSIEDKLSAHDSSPDQHLHASPNAKTGKGYAANPPPDKPKV